MFASSTKHGYGTPLPGIAMKTLVYGDNTLLTEFRLEKGSELPMHAHPHEQTGYLVAGSLRLTIGEGQFEVKAGDAWCIPGGVRHCAIILEDSVAIEVFSPVRQEYIPAA